MAPIARGQPWGQPGPLPADGVVVGTDREASRVLEQARRAGAAFPALGLLGGDLHRTLGGSGRSGAAGKRLRSTEAVTFTVDLGEVLVDGRLRLFLAHVVAHSPSWHRTWVAMNAQWRGRWNAAPRAHPNDGLLDVYDARLSLVDRLLARGRLPRGTHVPHPDISSRRVAAAQVGLDPAARVEVDGERIGSCRNVSVRVEPDAVTVVV